MYREVEAPAVEKPKPSQLNFDTQRFSNDSERIRNALQIEKVKLGIKGELIYPPPVMDLSNYVFDVVHTQGDKHPHDVNEEEARRFIADACFVIYTIKNNSYNYFSKEGAAYVQPNKKTIKTAFKAEEYNPKFKAMMEAYENARG